MSRVLGTIHWVADFPLRISDELTAGGRNPDSLRFVAPHAKTPFHSLNFALLEINVSGAPKAETVRTLPPCA